MDHGVAVQSSIAEPKAIPSGRAVEQTRVRFADIYSEYFQFVWRNLRRLGIAEAALRDAAQDVFIVVHRRLHEFDGSDGMQAWLYSILRRVAADHRRRGRRKDWTNDEQPDSIIDPREPGPEARASRGEAMRLLVSLLDTLDEEWRDLVVLVDMEGMSVPEAALVVNCNANTAYSRLRSARQVMQDGFDRYLAEERRSR
jgi:RNA polymerase sigma-70 factor (ECF subfamily)